MSHRGITLLELLVVLVIAGILGSLAIPAYQHHLMRVSRTEAITDLQALLAAQERFYQRHGRYAADLHASPPQGLGFRPSSTHYSLAISLAADGQTFIATAAPLPGSPQQRDNQCRAFSVDQRSRRAVRGEGTVEKCWR